MSKGTIKLLVAGVIAVTLMIVVGLYKDQIGEYFDKFNAWVQEAGMVGVVAFGLVYILATVAFIPGTLLTIGAGLAFGAVKGSIIVSLASTTGALLAFLLARTFLRSTIEQKVQSNPSFGAIDHAISQSGAKIVFLVRLSPVFPFNLLNYGLGLTSIPTLKYLIASWIGMMPGTIMFVYLASIPNQLAQGAEKTTGEKVFFYIGLIVTIIVTLFVTRIATRALKKELNKNPDTDQNDGEPTTGGIDIQAGKSE